MRSEPKLRTRTRDKHVARTAVTRGHTTLADVRGEISEARRGQVYRTDVEFAEVEPRRSAPHKTAAEVQRVRELRATGLSQLDIAVELDMAQATVARLCRKHNIAKSAGGSAG